MRVFTFTARFEALTWAGLLLGLVLKYVTGTTDFVVWLFGRLHGGGFFFYVLAALVATHVLRWKWWVAVVAIGAAVLPLATLPVIHWMRQREPMTLQKQGRQALAVQAMDEE